MVAARLGVVYHHTVAAHQTIDQRLDAHRAQAYLAIADNNTGLHDVAGYDLCLQAGVDNLDAVSYTHLDVYKRQQEFLCH